MYFTYILLLFLLLLLISPISLISSHFSRFSQGSVGRAEGSSGVRGAQSDGSPPALPRREYLHLCLSLSVSVCLSLSVSVCLCCLIFLSHSLLSFCIIHTLESSPSYHCRNPPIISISSPSMPCVTLLKSTTGALSWFLTTLASSRPRTACSGWWRIRMSGRGKRVSLLLFHRFYRFFLTFLSLFYRFFIAFLSLFDQLLSLFFS